MRREDGCQGGEAGGGGAGSNDRFELKQVGVCCQVSQWQRYVKSHITCASTMILGGMNLGEGVKGSPHPLFYLVVL